MMGRAATFFQPTRNKLIFLAEWLLFIGIALLQGTLKTGRHILIAVYPLLFFYIIACIFAELSCRRQRFTQGGWMLILALALMLLDQFIKLVVVAYIPFGTAVPLVDGWLNLAHSCNFQGSWLLATLDAAAIWLLPSVLLAIVMGLCSWFCYRYYVVNQRASLWADVAFLGLFAGLASWLVEMALRGHIVDFICLPDLVSADLKDIYLALGISAIFVEYLDNPSLLRVWQGWRRESRNWRQLVTNIINFSWQELRDAWTRVIGKV